MPKQKALCVGINNFANLPNARLSGCVNDANDMAALLVETRGFATSDITILTDAAATKAAVMSALRGLVNLAADGNLDTLVFSFSSHGTQVPDLDGDEQPETMGELKGTKADEAFCPTDLIQKGDIWDADHVISDDELHDVFVTVPVTCAVEVFMDTCHSGTGLKAIDLLGFPGQPRPRYLAPPSFAAFRALNAPKATPKPRSMLSTAKEPRKADAVTRKGSILWAGCRSDQTSADATFDNRPNGAFTYFYIKNARLNPKATRAQLITRVRADLKRAKYEQIPQLELDATTR